MSVETITEMAVLPPQPRSDAELLQFARALNQASAQLYQTVARHGNTHTHASTELTWPATVPVAVTGVYDSLAGMPAVIKGLLTALDTLGLIDDQTTAAP